MCKRILFTSSLCFTLLFLFMSSVCIAGVTEQLEQAKDYRDIGDYSQAVTLYQSIVSSNPGTIPAFKAQREIAALEVLQGRETEALAAYQALLSNYSDNNLIANAVAHVGDAYCKIKDYEKAAQLYQYSLSNWPNANGAMNSHRGLAVLGVLQNDDNAVTSAADKIVSDFSGNKKFGKAIYEIGIQCFDLKKYDLAETVYQKFMASHSNSEQVIWPTAGVALLKFYKGDNTAAQTALNTLKTNFAGNADLPNVLYNVARLCERSHKNTEAAGIYQQVITDYAGTDWAVRSQIDTSVMNIVSLIESGQDSQAQSAYNSLISTYGSYPKIARSLNFIGEAYYDRAQKCERDGLDAQADYAKAVSIWERLIEQSPYKGLTEFAYYFSAISYTKLGNNQKALEYYSEVCDRRDFDFAWNAQFMTGRIREGLVKEGKMTELEAEPLIRQVYEELIEKYPNCKSAKAAQRWLSRHNSK